MSSTFKLKHAMPQLWIRSSSSGHNEEDFTFALKPVADAGATVAGAKELPATLSSLSPLRLLLVKASSSGHKFDNDNAVTSRTKTQHSRSGHGCQNQSTVSKQQQRLRVSVVDAGCTCRATVTTSTSTYQKQLQQHRNPITSDPAARHLNSAAELPKSSRGSVVAGAACTESKHGSGGRASAASGRNSTTTEVASPEPQFHKTGDELRNNAGKDDDYAMATEFELLDLMQKKTRTTKCTEERSSFCSSSAIENSSSISRNSAASETGSTAATLPSLQELLREYVATKSDRQRHPGAPGHDLTCFRDFESSMARAIARRRLEGKSRHGVIDLRDARVDREKLEEQDGFQRTTAAGVVVASPRARIHDETERGGVQPPPPVEVISMICSRTRSSSAQMELQGSPSYEETDSGDGDDEGSEAVGSCDEENDDEDCEHGSCSGGSEDDVCGAGAVAIVKSSLDPVHDFKQSMAEMVAAKRLTGAAQLQDLLLCYLSLNSRCYHAAIISAFRQVCEGGPF